MLPTRKKFTEIVDKSVENIKKMTNDQNMVRDLEKTMVNKGREFLSRLF